MKYTTASIPSRAKPTTNVAPPVADTLDAVFGTQPRVNPTSSPSLGPDHTRGFAEEKIPDDCINIKSLDPSRPEPIRGMLKLQGKQLPDLPKPEKKPPPKPVQPPSFKVGGAVSVTTSFTPSREFVGKVRLEAGSLGRITDVFKGGLKVAFGDKGCQFVSAQEFEHLSLQKEDVVLDEEGCKVTPIKIRFNRELNGMIFAKIANVPKLRESVRREAVRNAAFLKCYWKLAPRQRFKRKRLEDGKFEYTNVEDIKYKLSKSLNGKNPFLVFNYIAHAKKAGFTKRVTRDRSGDSIALAELPDNYRTHQRPKSPRNQFSKPPAKRRKVGKPSGKKTPDATPAKSVSSKSSPPEEPAPPGMFHPSSLRTSETAREYPTASKLAKSYRSCYTKAMSALQPMLESKEIERNDVVLMLNGVVRTCFTDAYALYCREYDEFLKAMRITTASVGHDTFFTAHLHAHFDSTEYFNASAMSKRMVTSWELPAVLRNTVTALFKVAWQCAIASPRMMLGNPDIKEKYIYDAAKHEAIQDSKAPADLSGRIVLEHLWPTLHTTDAKIHVRELVTLAPR